MGNSHRVLQSSLIPGPPRSTLPCGFPLPQRIENERNNKLYLFCSYSHWRLVKLGFTFLKLKIEMRNHCGCVLTVRKHKGIFRKYTKQEVKSEYQDRDISHTMLPYLTLVGSHIWSYLQHINAQGSNIPLRTWMDDKIHISPYIQNPL